MMKTLRLAALTAAAFVAAHAALAAELKVVASFSIIADLAGNVGGDRIDLVTLVGPNGDAHAYEPKPADAAAVASADLVLVNGAGLEGFLRRLVEASGTQAVLVELTAGVELRELSGGHGHGHADDEPAEAHGHDHGPQDPHAWQDVGNAGIYVENIADALCRADAAGCDAYRANAAAYGGKLAALDAEIRTSLAAVPADRRTIITSHDAFGYFADAYGLDFVAPEGTSTEAEATAADVAALIRQVREDKASAIFVENITNPNLIEQIARETGLRIGGELFSDALSDADGPAATYIDMMRHNLSVIKGAVLGS